MMEIIERKDAFAKGYSKYFTGISCRKGHLSQRYVVTGACTACQRDHMKKYRKPQYGTMRLTVDLHPDDFEMVKAFAMAIIEGRNRGPNLASAKAARQALVDHANTGAATPPAGRLKDLAAKAPPPPLEPLPGVTVTAPARPPLAGPGAAFAAMAATGALSPFEDD